MTLMIPMMRRTMMHLNLINWDDIKKPTADFAVKKLKTECQLPVYLGKDVQGHNLLIIELEGDHSEFLNKKRPLLHGISIDIRQEVTVQRLVFRLQNLVDKDIFESFCDSLLTAIADVKDSSVCVAKVLEHMKRWKDFLAGRKIRKLSDEEVQGLFAELQFLKTLISDYGIEEEAAIEAWEGGTGFHQDFIFKNTAVEIKSLSGKERGSVKISSEDQLEGVVETVLLKVYRLTANFDHFAALSLNEQVERLKGLMVSPAEGYEAFINKLAGYGYAPLSEYDKLKFIVTDENTYEVKDDFPRIIRSALPGGILKVKYELELHRIEPYLIDNQVNFGD